MIAKLIPTGLFSRFLIIILLPMILLQIVVVIVFYERHWDSVTNNLRKNLIADLKATVYLINHPLQHGDLLNQMLEDFGFTYQILPNQQLPALHVNVNQDDMLKRFTRNLHKSFMEELLVQYADESANSINFYLQLPQDLLQISFSSKKLRSPTTYIFIFWIIGVATLLIIISTIFIRNQIKSIINLAELADKFGKGQNVSYFHPSGAKEIRTAGKAFIKMKKRIERQIQYRAELLAHISHDFRTPLTRLKLQLSMLDRNINVQEMNDDIQEMEKLIVDYLNFAKGEGNENVVAVQVKPAIMKTLSNIDDPRLSISCDLEEGQVLFMRPLAFQRALQNILGNAVKYANKKIDVLITASSKNLLIIVDDDGAGISATDYQNAFKPFYKLDDTKLGHGLGLAIVKNIMQAHGGKIKLSQNSYDGLRVTLFFPL